MSDIKLNNNNVLIEGNVGIGTSSPTNSLHVVGSGPVTIENPNGEADILYKSGNNPSWQAGTNSVGWYVWDNAYRLVVKPGGNVGIGTSNPTNLLHVVGSGPVTIENPNGEADILFKSGNNPSWQAGTNNKGWYVWDNAYRLVVKPGGNVGIGTDDPTYKLHVEGGEVRSSGASAGFSFTDRIVSGKAWHWYATNQEARLGPEGPGGDALTIRQNGTSNSYAVQINGTLVATVGEFRGTSVSGKPEDSTIRCRSAAFTLENPAAPLSMPLPTELVDDPSVPVPARIALFHDFENNKKDGLVINYQNRYKGGVKIEGTVQATGALTQASSIALKENIAELSGQEAMAALQGLSAVKYNYKADSQKEQRIGFIAEDVPELVASTERDRLSPMDLIAVLTKAVQEQQKTIAELSTAMKHLKLSEGGLA
jgi:hypothetical protein